MPGVAPRVSRSFPRRQGTGFTLAEMVMVVAITATLAAITIPRYLTALNRYRLDAAARRIAADLTMARLNARDTGTARTVTFATSTDSYDISGMTDPDHPA